MKEYEQLIKECKNESEKKAVFNIFIMIQCLKKHDKLRQIVKNGKYLLDK